MSRNAHAVHNDIDFCARATQPPSQLITLEAGECGWGKGKVRGIKTEGSLPWRSAHVHCGLGIEFNNWTRAAK